jgi:hypothetical protein
MPQVTLVSGEPYQFFCAGPREVLQQSDSLIEAYPPQPIPVPDT